jgi:hypothetical protein
MGKKRTVFEIYFLLSLRISSNKISKFEIREKLRWMTIYDFHVSDGRHGRPFGRLGP